MTALTFLIQTMASMALGFVVGFLLGRTVRDVHRIADAVSEQQTVAENTEENVVPLHRPRRAPWLTGQLVVAVVVVLLGALTVAQGLIQSAATERLTTCVADYSNQFADALDARSKASADAQASLDELISVIADATDPAAIQRAIADYLAKREQVRDEQRTHPYPDPPRDACG